MSNTVANFGFNTDLENDSFYASENVGSKYNFNTAGNVLGIFSNNNGQCYLLSQVTESFGDNCMVGTIDAREITSVFENAADGLISNNELSMECMTISRILSAKDVRDELITGKEIEQTKGFNVLKSLGINLDRLYIQLGETVAVSGVEPAKFEHFKNSTINENR